MITVHITLGCWGHSTAWPPSYALPTQLQTVPPIWGPQAVVGMGTDVYDVDLCR